MKISIPIEADTTNLHTSVVDHTELWDNTIHQSYPAEQHYRHDNTIYENTGETVIVPLYNPLDVYTINQTVYDGTASKVSRIVDVGGGTVAIPKPPSAYASLDAGFDHTTWTNRYSKLLDIPVTHQEGLKYGTTEFYTSAAFSADGLNLYGIGHRPGTYVDIMTQHTLSVAYDITTATQVYETTADSVTAMAFNPTGTVVWISYLIPGAYPYVYYIGEYTLSTPWDLSTLAIASTHSPLTGATNRVGAIAFNNDGTVFYEANGETIIQSAITPYTLGTRAQTGTLDLSAYVGSGVTGITFNPTGTIVYVAAGRMHQFSLATPWDISTATRTYYNFYGPYTMLWDGSTGDRVIGPTRTGLKRYTVERPWEITLMYNTVFPLYVRENRGTHWYGFYLEYDSFEDSYTSSGAIYDLNGALVGGDTFEDANVYSVLTNDTIDDKAYIVPAGGYEAWVGKTYVKDSTGLYVRTNKEVIPETYIPSEYTLEDVVIPDRIPGFVALEASDDYKPFDTKNYTYASANSAMIYRFESADQFDTLALGRVKADNIVIRFTLPETSPNYGLWLDGVSVVEGGNGIHTVISDDVNTSRDSHKHLPDWYTTLIYYPDNDMVMEAGSEVEVLLGGDTIELGTLLLGISAEAGFTNLAIKNDYKDYSVFGYDEWGNVDYTERAKVSRYSGSVDVFIENYDTTDRLMASLGKNLVIVNGSDANSTSAPSVSIFAATQKIGRFIAFSQKTMIKDNDIGRVSNYTFTLEEIV